ncbi:ergosterol biosynthetic protein 28 homolog [Corticium candelabrum]|uniref:ergosterol biosynthetic protein 28 homolog n=1 Tax=Corticium candelabrum TaxID=121492 RepID=UPI002E258076|nr:ergosterol biosynthetic protein 28 homolog [Corticium candelabrum]
MLVGALRVWLAVVGSTALFSAVQSYVSGAAIIEKIYTNAISTSDGGALLTARVFGSWTSLAATVRLLAAADIKNRSIYVAAVVSFVVAFVHFILETVVYGTAAATAGLVIPVVVSGISILWMAIMFPIIFAQDEQKKSS